MSFVKNKKSVMINPKFLKYRNLINQHLLDQCKEENKEEKKEKEENDLKSIHILDSISEEHEIEVFESYLNLTAENLSKHYNCSNKKENLNKNEDCSNSSVKSIKSQCGSIENASEQLRKSIFKIDIKSDGYQESTHDSTKSTHNGSDFEKISLTDRIFQSSSPDLKECNKRLKNGYLDKQKMNIVDIGIVLNSTISILRNFVS